MQPDAPWDLRWTRYANLNVPPLLLKTVKIDRSFTVKGRVRDAQGAINEQLFGLAGCNPAKLDVSLRSQVRQPFSPSKRVCNGRKLLPYEPFPRRIATGLSWHQCYVVRCLHGHRHVCLVLSRLTTQHLAWQRIETTNYARLGWGKKKQQLPGQHERTYTNGSTLIRPRPK